MRPHYYETRAWAASKMRGLLARLGAIPAFPVYPGPYKVGSVDVEIAVDELESPSPPPPNGNGIPTIRFRVFYPAVKDSREDYISWLPDPPRCHAAAYARFMGICSLLAEFLAFILRHFHLITIPAHDKAKIQDAATPDKRWPTMIFSHGLGGSRNSYSYNAGSLASYGMVVVCTEHRDGSAVASYVQPSGKDALASTKGCRIIPYSKVAHELRNDVYEAREDQLRIRLWEIALVHEALLALDKGQKFIYSTSSTLPKFKGHLDVHKPGRIIFSGHSFGATTIYQLLKSTYYTNEPALSRMDRPLFRPYPDSNIRKQITIYTATILLDMWCLPLLAPNSAPLFNFPMPIYADTTSTPNRMPILVLESEAFYRWDEHIYVKGRLLSPNPGAKIITPELFIRPDGERIVQPHFFYVANSAHISHSDFSILFPWLTKKIFKAEHPKVVLELNLRAQLQFFRVNHIRNARTQAKDMLEASFHTAEFKLDGLSEDRIILERSTEAKIDHWKSISITDLQPKS